VGANPSPCRCPILAQPGRGLTTAKSPSVDDWTCDFQGVRVKRLPQPMAESLAQRQTRKASHGRKNGVNPEPLRTRRLWELSIRYHGLTPSGFHSRRASENRTSENLARSARSSPQPRKDMFVFGRSAEDVPVREKSSASSRSFACASRVVRLGNLKMLSMSSGLTNVQSDDDR